MRGMSGIRHAALTRIRSAGDLPWLAAAVVIYAIQEIGISHLERAGWQADLRRFIFFSTTGAVILLALHFRRYAGAWLIALGIAMNFVPMAAHGGLMPVAFEVIEESGEFPEITPADIGRQLENSKDIVLWREDIHFYRLSDRHHVVLPVYGGTIYSRGDFVAFVGVLAGATQALLAIFFPVLGGSRPPARAGRPRRA